MSLRTNRTVIALRNAGRALGVNRLLSSLLAPGGYEGQFQNAMFDAVQAGDCVWDVGANVGLYTTNVAERVGLSGKVCAFEPSPENPGAA